MRIASQIPNSDQSPLYDVRNPARASCEGQRMRSDVSRTMFLATMVSPSSLFRATPGTLRSACPAAPRIAEGEAWWSQTGSNRRPHACKARALPAELWPRTRRRMLHVDIRERRYQRRMRSIKVVGLGRLELPTSRLSSARSNQLSYKPQTTNVHQRIGACSRATDLRRMFQKRFDRARIRRSRLAEEPSLERR